MYFSDCSSPFTVTFITNSEAAEDPAATTAQRGTPTVLLHIYVDVLHIIV